jgi:FKBP-type peptidyl-prolyl cis-trans isomerase
MTVGTIGGFVAIILANDNQQKVQDQTSADYQKQLEEYTKQQEIAAKENADNSEPIDGYTATPFTAADVTSLNAEVLVEGSGEAIKSTDTVKASYFGWLSDGMIFDSSNKKDADDTPISFPLANVIKGWTDGLTGKKVGSVIKLTIPADQAYGSTASGVIPANSPLQFIVKIDSIEAAQS